MVSSVCAVLALAAAANAKLAPISSRVGAVRAPAPAASKALATYGGGYNEWAKNNANANGMILGAVKTAAADFLAQLGGDGPFDLKRNMLFFAFGAIYLGAFQYWYQVNIFKKIFTATERWTSESIGEKLKDGQGQLELLGQMILNAGVLMGIYLPTFYLFKAVFFSDCGPVSCFTDTWEKYTSSLAKDIPPLLQCWVPADFVCFSVPLYLRIPIRHIVSFCWTIYFSYVQAK